MLPRFRHLLVPVDFTEKNQSALEIAFEIAVNNRARVTLLHVVEEVPGADAELKQFIERLQQRAESEIERCSQKFAQAGVEIETKVRVGRRLPEIVQAQQERQVDLVILSSHPIDPIQPVKSWNSLSYQVSVVCPCPVLLVK